MVDDGDGAVTELERELLRAGRQQRLAPGERERIWAGLGAAIAVAPAISAAAEPVATAGATAGATKALGAAAIVKGTVLAVMLGGGVVAGYHAIGSRGVEVAPLAGPGPSTTPLLPPAVAPPAPVPERIEQPAPAPAARVPRAEASRPTPTPSRLAAEGQIVLEARRALRDGDATAALHRLERARRAFADGALVQEREALTIEALHRAGQREAAASRARVFLRAYPGSPHAASVRAFAAP
jgi:hypothetical protein